jgi:hypothetical protein
LLRGPLLVAVAAALPAIGIVILIARYGVSIPLLDDWEMVPLVTDARQGRLSFAAIFEQQQEARTVFPKFLFLVFAVVKHWDGRVIMMVSVLLCFVTALGVYRLLRRTGISSRGAAVVFLLVLPLIFSPAQHELWLLASGAPSFVPALCLVWAMCVLTGDRSVPAKFWLCLAFTVIASFTLANGLLLWGLTFPAFFAMNPRRRDLRWFFLWWVACGICAAAYFAGFKHRPDLPAFAPPKPLSEYLHYVAVFLGSGLARSGNSKPLAASTIVGAIALAGYLAALGYSLFRWRDRAYCARAVPWLAVASFSVGSACLAALGRIEWGVAQALESRYVTFSLYCTVGLVVLAAIFLKHFVATFRGNGARVGAQIGLGILGVAYVAVLATCAFASIPFFKWRSATARMGYGGVLFSQVLDTSRAIQAGNFPRPFEVQQRANALDRLRMLRTPLIRTTRISEMRRSDLNDESAGWLDAFQVHDGTGSASGWAALPRRPADCVVLAYQDGAGEWIAFAVSSVLVARPDVTAKLGNREFLWSGWRAEFPVAGLPRGAQISAWGLDAKGAKLHRLKSASALPTL